MIAALARRLRDETRAYLTQEIGWEAVLIRAAIATNVVCFLIATAVGEWVAALLFMGGAVFGVLFYTLGGGR